MLRICIPLILLFFVISACTGEPDAPPSMAPAQSEQAEEQVIMEGWSSTASYHGVASLEEVIMDAAVIAMGRLQSVTPSSFVADIDRDGTLWNVPALVHTFSVSEYLKGTGDDQVVAIVDAYEGFETTGDAVAYAEGLLDDRDAQWDSREAIIFLESHYAVDDKYSLGGYSIRGYDYYSIASDYYRLWLPAESATPLGGNSWSNTNQSQSFLLEVPEGGASQGGSNGRANSPGNTDGPETISLRGMKSLIASIEQEIVDGGGTQEYRDCIRGKYELERLVEHKKTSTGKANPYYRREDVSLASGLPAGTLAFRSEGYGALLQEYGSTRPPNSGDTRLLGEDGRLFVHTWPGVIHTARPLPSGEYRFFWSWRSQTIIPCDGQPEEMKKQVELFVAVEAPPWTVLEAFFDPKTIGSGDGYVSSGDASTGDLSNTDFTLIVGGTDVSITALTGDASNVVLSLDPYNALAGHTLDFITGDGTTSLTLTGDAATGDSTAKTLTWAVGSAPWSSGDELMLRISASPPDYAERTRSTNAFTESTCDGAVTVPLWDDPVDDELLIDCEAIFDGIVTLQGGHLTRWNPQSNLDDWRGVSVDVVDGVVRVTGLNLTDMGMSGAFPASFAKVDSLTSLKLTGNTFTGCIPPYLYYVDDHDLNTLGLDPCT